MSNFINRIKQSSLAGKIKVYVKQYEEEEHNNIIHIITKGVKYFITILFLTHIAKVLIELPVKIAYKYDIELSGDNYVTIFKNYSGIFICSIIVIIVALPAIRLIGRLKHASKDGLDFYEENIKQAVQKDVSNNAPQTETIKDIINSDDEESYDESTEENMYKQLLDNQQDYINIYKCKNIKSNMKPLTLKVTNELFNNWKDNINNDVVYDRVKSNIKKKRKITDDRYKEITENIMYFLINNDIIESDDLEYGKYYFTSFGNTFINYFQNGII
jgi:hypothetical protein